MNITNHSGRTLWNGENYTLDVQRDEAGRLFYPTYWEPVQGPASKAPADEVMWLLRELAKTDRRIPKPGNGTRTYGPIAGRDTKPEDTVVYRESELSTVLGFDVAPHLATHLGAGSIVPVTNFDTYWVETIKAWDATADDPIAVGATDLVAVRVVSA